MDDASLNGGSEKGTDINRAYERGEQAALARRSAVRRAWRRLRHLAIRVLLRTHRMLRRPVATDGFMFWPPPDTPSTIADLSGRSTWYLGPTDRPVTLSAGTVPHGASDASYLDPGLIGQRDQSATVARPHLLLHESSVGAIARAVARPFPITYVDPDGFNASDVGGYEAILNRYLSTRVPRRTFADLRASLGTENGAAFLLCTGPSSSTIVYDRVEADLRIVCNSAVRDEEVLSRLRPNVITFADPVFHFGPSRYAAAFRADMLRAVERTDAWVVVPELLGRLLLHHHPELEDRTVLLEHSADRWTWPGRDGTETVRPTANILTLMMLPTAFALADDIVIAGCDGREPGERYFWKHSPRVQYSDDLMRSVWAAHPSFFRDRDYQDYYAQHCVELAELISVGEAGGKTVQSATRSHIPALAIRRMSRGNRLCP